MNSPGDLRISRSELYARTLATYVADQPDDEVTARLDAVYADADSHLDPQVAAAQREAISE